MTNSLSAARPVLTGFGGYAPPKVVTNNDLSKFIETNDDWIVTRTGIKERRISEDHVTNSDLAAEAAKKALASSGLAASDITHILYGTCTADSACPSTACVLAHKLNIVGAFAVDVNAACTSFVYALELAKGIVAGTPSANVLVIGADIFSKHLNWEDRGTCILFGDGAGAAIVQSKAGDIRATGHTADLLDILYSSDCSLGDLISMKGGFSSHPYKKGDIIGAEYFLSMQGREVFRHAVRSMSSMSTELLARNGLTVNDIHCIVPHQANLRIIEAVAQRIDAPMDKFFVNVNAYGNTSAASIPLAMYEALQRGVIKKNALVLLVTFGSGFTWSSALLKFS